MIHFRCVKCNDVLSAPESLAGKTETCPGCQNVCLVPTVDDKLQKSNAKKSTNWRANMAAASVARSKKERKIIIVVLLIGFIGILAIVGYSIHEKMVEKQEFRRVSDEVDSLYKKHKENMKEYEKTGLYGTR